MQYLHYIHVHKLMKPGIKGHHSTQLPYAWIKHCPQRNHRCITGKEEHQVAIRRQEGKEGVGDNLERYVNLAKSQDKP